MYPHEKKNENKKAIIIAILLHIAVIAFVFVNNLNIFNKKENKTVENSTQYEYKGYIPPPDSVLAPQKINIEELNNNTVKAQAVEESEINKAIDNFTEEKRSQILKQKQAEEAIRLQKIQQEEIENKERLEQQMRAEAAAQLQIKKSYDEKQEQIKALQAQTKIEKALEEASKVKEPVVKEKPVDMPIKDRGYDSQKLSLSKDEKLGLLKKYRDEIYNKVYSTWERPPGLMSGTVCTVHITQDQKGKVERVDMVRCQNSDKLYSSVVKAIFNASPLPLPEHESLFNNNIEITFKVN